MPTAGKRFAAHRGVGRSPRPPPASRLLFLLATSGPAAGIPALPRRPTPRAAPAGPPPGPLSWRAGEGRGSGEGVAVPLRGLGGRWHPAPPPPAGASAGFPAQAPARTAPRCPGGARRQVLPQRRGALGVVQGVGGRLFF